MNNRNKKKSTFILGVAGASGSGKSFFADRIYSSLRSRNVIILSQDYYYKDLSSIPPKQRALYNFDHPDAIDFDLLIEHIKLLKKHQSIQHPIYDFTVHNRKKESVTAGPADIVIIDGILIYALPKIRDLFDFKVYIETPPDICFIRRLQRDTLERGRTMESVISQYLETVRPMYERFVLPTKNYSDLVTRGEGDMDKALQLVLQEKLR